MVYWAVATLISIGLNLFLLISLYKSQLKYSVSNFAHYDLKKRNFEKNSEVVIDNAFDNFDAKIKFYVNSHAINDEVALNHDFEDEWLRYEIFSDSLSKATKTISYCVIDKDWNYIYHNANHKRVLKSFGYELEPNDSAINVLNFFDQVYFDRPMVEKVKIRLNRVLSGEQYEGLEIIKFRNRDSHYMHIEFIPLKSKSDVCFGAAMIMRDVTQEQVMYKELKQVTEEERNSNQAKSMFLANMSHEIRTPMNGILGLTDLLLETELSDKQRESLGLIKKSGISLLGIINDILDFSKIESGNFSIMEENVNIIQLVNEINEFFLLKSEERKLEFTCTIDPNVPVCLVLDSLRIRQILINLLGNAFKFTEKGYVRLVLRRIVDKQGNEFLKVTVEDSGAGIPYDKLTCIFERFKQAENNYNRSYDGTGLGLAICKQLVTAMNGRIEVISKLEVGSIFFFEIPLRRGELKAMTLPESHVRLVFSKDIRILVAEDNMINAYLIKAIMEKINVSLDIATNGMEAVEMASQKPYDLILMDISMPRMDGVEAFSVIRNKLKLTVPIVALTAHSLVEDRQRILSAGMTDYLTKPFIEKDIIAVIEKYVINRSKIYQEPTQAMKAYYHENKDKTALGKFRTTVDTDTVNRPIAAANNSQSNNVVELNQKINYNGYYNQQGSESLSYSEAYNGILHVESILEGDKVATADLVKKLIAMVDDASLAHLKQLILTNKEVAIYEWLHKTKGAVVNFGLKHLYKALEGVKNIEWSNALAVEKQMDLIKEQVAMFNAAYKAYCELNRLT